MPTWLHLGDEHVDSLQLCVNGNIDFSRGHDTIGMTQSRPCDGGKFAPSLKKSEDGEVEEFSRASGPTEESQVMVISNKLLTPFGGLIQRSIGLMVSLGR